MGFRAFLKRSTASYPDKMAAIRDSVAKAVAKRFQSYCPELKQDEKGNWEGTSSTGAKWSVALTPQNVVEVSIDKKAILTVDARPWGLPTVRYKEHPGPKVGDLGNLLFASISAESIAREVRSELAFIRKLPVKEGIITEVPEKKPAEAKGQEKPPEAKPAKGQSLPSAQDEENVLDCEG